MSNIAELGQEYATIVLRQETGMDLWGDLVEKFQPGDSKRLLEIEKIFADANDFSLSQYVSNWFEIQKENIK